MTHESYIHYRIAMHPDRINVFRSKLSPVSLSKFDNGFDQEVDNQPRQLKIEFNEFVSRAYEMTAGEPLNHKELEIKEAATERIINSSRKADGVLSINAKRKLRRAIDYLLFIAQEKTVTTKSSHKKFKFKVNFITLTLSSKQIHTDQVITNQLLNQFLVECKAKYKTDKYIWRAEKQKNGNIHYHILFDKYIEHTDLRDLWNRIQNKLGYVDRYTESMRSWHKNGFRVRTDLLKEWPIARQIKAYQEGMKSNFTRPNSTDVHSLKKINDVRAYIMKYVMKEIDLQKITNEEDLKKLLVSGRLWSCSQTFSKITGLQEDVDNFISELLTKIKESGAAKVIEDYYFSIFLFNIKELAGTVYDDLLRRFEEYCVRTFNLSYQLSLT